MPIRVITRPIQSELDAQKVDSLADTLQVRSQGRFYSFYTLGKNH
jgi:hypothetical protein